MNLFYRGGVYTLGVRTAALSERLTCTRLAYLSVITCVYVKEGQFTFVPILHTGNRAQAFPVTHRTGSKARVHITFGSRNLL